LLYQQDKMVRNGQFNTFIHQLLAGNVHYANNLKYFADLSISYSGTNVLPKGSRFGFFPAVSLGWKVSEEQWFSKNVFDNLKLRGYWGITENDLIPHNHSMVQFNGSTPYFFTPNNSISGGLQEGRLPSNNLTYETAIKYNFGVDATMFGMVDINVDAFY